MIQFQTKFFTELSITELYQLLQLRSEVFVVEQNCIYQDIDGKDDKAIHILGYYNAKLVAYTRLFQKGIYFKEASIGRVLVSSEYRDKNFGNHLITYAIQEIYKIFNETQITISAQEYLQKFYETHGFIKKGKAYLEDGIHHIKMQIK